MTISVDKPIQQGVLDVIIPAATIPTLVIERYWKDLLENDLLRYRLCDLKGPKIEDAMTLTAQFLQYFLVDPADSRIRAEFVLNNFTGKAAQVHFSMHPDNTPQRSLHLARRVTDQVLNEWTPVDKPDEPFLYSLFGLTPVDNRAACAFVQRVGFRKLGVLPGGQLSGGEPTDAMITIKKSRRIA